MCDWTFGLLIISGKSRLSLLPYKIVPVLIIESYFIEMKLLTLLTAFVAESFDQNIFDILMSMLW